MPIWMPTKIQTQTEIPKILNHKFQCHTYKFNVYANPDAYQKPNTNREAKIIESEI